MDGSKLNETGEDSWKLPPEAVDEIRGPSQEEMHRAAERAWDKEILQGHYLSNRSQIRFFGKYGWVLWWKPLGLTIACFGIGIALIVGQFWVPELDASFGNPLAVLRTSAPRPDLARRLAVHLNGGPLFKPDDWTPAKQVEEDRAHDYFRRKRGL